MNLSRMLGWASPLALSVLVAGAAEAKIPEKAATADDLGIAIGAAAGDIYTLPAGKTIYHGTFRPFPAFKARDGATWFGANYETSEAMGYFRWCSSARMLTTKFEKNQSLAPLEAHQHDALNAKSWPHVMKVKVKAAINLLLVPYGKNGHGVQFLKIGHKLDKSLFGVGSEGGIAAMKESKLCGTKVWLKDKKIVGYQRPGDKAVTGKQEGTEIALEGWRAPWDQNEIAVCGGSLAGKLEVDGAATKMAETHHGELLPLYTTELEKELAVAPLGGGDLPAIKLKKVIDGKTHKLNGAAKVFQTKFLAITHAICDESSKTHTGSVSPDNNEAFDIVFTKGAPHGEAEDAKKGLVNTRD